MTSSVSPLHFSLLHTKSKPNVTHSPSSPLLAFHSSNLNFRRVSRFQPDGFLPRCSSGDGDRTVLDAFFLGKALAEALTERIESTIGEVLGGIGRLQAEQQKQILDFQEEVIERAKKAKDKAARDAKEQGPISSSIISPTTGVTSSQTTSTYQQLSNLDPDSGTTVPQGPLGYEE